MMKKITSTLLAFLLLFSGFAVADNKLNWYEMYESNSNGQITLKDDTGSAVLATANPTGSYTKTAYSTATQPASTVRLRLTTAAAGDACQTPRDDIAITADRSLILICKDGVWKKQSTDSTVSGTQCGAWTTGSSSSGTKWTSCSGLGKGLCPTGWTARFIGEADWVNFYACVKD